MFKSQTRRRPGGRPLLALSLATLFLAACSTVKEPPSGLCPACPTCPAPGTPTLTPDSAKPWKGLGSGVYEMVEDHRGDTFRAVYTVRVGDAVHVLHAFQKKSKSGIATPQPDVELIEKRLKAVLARYGASGRS